jgi:3-deoxy-D-manno-octulosonate 8-phosphate phosphatase (KDO 8-P phosphatase)
MNATAHLQSVIEKAKQIKALFLDVDGVLTSGEIFYSELGETIKRFNTLDGQGLRYLIEAGVSPVIITGRKSLALSKRLTDLGIEQIHMGVHDKRQVAQQVLDELGLDWTQAAGVGDDWPDLPILLRVAISFAPQNAHLEIKTRVDFLTQNRGGEGCVREVCDLILKAIGKYQATLEQYTK